MFGEMVGEKFGENFSENRGECLTEVLTEILTEVLTKLIPEKPLINKGFSAFQNSEKNMRFGGVNKLVQNQEERLRKIYTFFLFEVVNLGVLFLSTFLYRVTQRSL
ncbi:hypothetical protein [Gorillibacterium sp. sgz5001074]|uniref:hypothetical protein n=1 Tax=Gorillibacterium sp. sgz5001074 TaxID=3446695 RepID=UPI003F66ABD1